MTIDEFGNKMKKKLFKDVMLKSDVPVLWCSR